MSVKGQWSRVKDLERFGANMDAIQAHERKRRKQMQIESEKNSRKDKQNGVKNDC